MPKPQSRPQGFLQLHFMRQQQKLKKQKKPKNLFAAMPPKHMPRINENLSTNFGALFMKGKH